MANYKAALAASAPADFSLLIFRIAILFLFFQPKNVQGQDIRMDNNEVSVKTSTGFQQITHDGTPKRLPVISPDGKRIVYVVDLWLTHGRHNDDSGDPEDIVETNIEGKVLRHIIPEGYIPVQFDRLEWIDNHRVGGMGCGHANCAYWVLDADTGKTLKMMEGGFDFIWSHSRRWVARRFINFGSGGDGESPSEFDRLMLNDDWVYPSPREDMIPRAPGSKPIHGHTIGESIVWSPNDAWVAFTDMQGPEGDNYVVLASPRGLIMRDTIAGDVSFNAQIKWTDDAHLEVIAGGRTFSLIVIGNELRDVTRTQ
jgi:WD40-like Beta Propeller Repeat